MTINRNRKAFTIVELIIVIAVIGVLAAILIPTFSNVIKKANAKSALSDAKNSLTGFIAAATENENLPENIVFFIHKAGAFWVYGYQKAGGGQLLQSDGNGTASFSGYESDELEQFMLDHNCPSAEYDPDRDYAGSDYYFYLIQRRAMRAIAYPELTGFDAPDGASTYEGVLLPGTFVGEFVNVVETVRITFVNGNDNNGDPVDATMPTPVDAVKGSTFIPASHTPTAPLGYAFAGWLKDGAPATSFEANADTTLTASWTVIPPITVTFDKDTADSITAPTATNAYVTNVATDADSVTLTVTSGANIANMLIDTKVTKTGEIQVGWKDEASDTTYTFAATSTAIFTADATLIPVWQQKYEIAFFNEGVACGTVSDFNGETVNLLAAPSPAPTGKLFYRWALTKDGEPYGSEMAANAEMTMQDFNLRADAVWTDAEFELEYAEGDPATTNAVRNMPEGTTVEMTPGGGTYTVSSTVPTCIGQKFAGWVSTLGGAAIPAGGSLAYTDSVVGGTVTLTATWTPCSNDLTINLDNGTAPTVSDTLYGDEVTVPAAPTKEGNTFANWTDGTNTYNPGDTFTMPDHDLTLTATWTVNKYTVTYLDGAGNDYEEEYSYGSTQAVLAIGDTGLTKEGWTFTYWTGTYADSGEEFNITGIAGQNTYTGTQAFTMPAGNLRFVASWNKQVTLTLVTRGEEAGRTVPTGHTITNENFYNNPATHTIAAGSSITEYLFVDDKVMTATGWTFGGWYVRGGDGTTYTSESGAIVMPSEDTVYVANWIGAPHNLTYDLSGGAAGAGVPSEAVSFFAGTSYTIPTDATASKSGMDFLGWRQYNGGTKGARVQAGGEINPMPNADVVLKAEFGFTVTYNLNYNGTVPSGLVAPAAASCVEGDEFTVDVNALTDPSSTYNFLGWNTDASATTAQYAAGAKFTPTGDTTLYAIWKMPSYSLKITFTDSWNGGSVDKTINGVASLSLTLADIEDALATVDYFVPAASSWTATASGTNATVTIAGTRLAKINGSSYVKYPATTSGSYPIDASCYQVVTTSTGFTKISNATYLTRRYLQQGTITVSGIDPIGWLSEDTPFSGIYDGDDNTINYSLVSGGSNKGLFCMNSGTIRNCKFAQSSSINGTSNLGGVVGSNSGRIEHCTHTGAVSMSSGSYDSAGGFVGLNEAGGVILDCHHLSGSVGSAGSGCQKVGGFCGVNLGTISWCSNQNNVAMTVKGIIAGGFVAQNGTGAKIEYSYCLTGKITAPTTVANTCVGGFAGRSYGEISNCFARTGGVITGAKYVTGFTTAMSTASKITNCYCYPSGSLSYNTSYNLVAFDVYNYAVGSISNSYLLSTTTNTSYVKFTKAANDSALKTAVNGNSSWTSAGCWDTTGSYVQLKTWAEMYGDVTATFNANLSGVANPAEVTVANGESVTMPNITGSIPTGFTLLGWADSASATTAQYNVGATVSLSSDKTFYAVWEYANTFSVTFTPGSHADATGMPGTISGIAYKGSATIPAAEPAVTTGDVFGGWSDGTNTYDAGATISNITSDITLVAQWLPLQHITCQADLEAIDTAAEMKGAYIVDNNFSVNWSGNCIGWLSSGDTEFTGTFDGNGKTITITNTSTGSNYGLFALNNGTIKDLTLVATFSGASNDKYDGGAIAGRNYEDGIIEGCTVTLVDFTGMHTIGGIAGRNLGIIRDCHVTSTKLKATGSASYDSGSHVGSMVGGITGYNYAGATVTLCSVSGKIDGYGNSQSLTSGGHVGGIVGWNKGNIDQCWFSGTLNNDYASGYGGGYIGGIAGLSANGTTISNCWAYLDYINGYDYEGGIVGLAGGTVSSCWAFAYNGGTYNGNYIGSITYTGSGTVTNCYRQDDDAFGCGQGTVVTDLTDGSPLGGFDTSIWEFAASSTPELKNNRS